MTNDHFSILNFQFTGDGDLALDIPQETILYFLKQFPGFELSANLRTFFHAAVRGDVLSNGAVTSGTGFSLVHNGIRQTPVGSKAERQFFYMLFALI